MFGGQAPHSLRGCYNQDEFMKKGWCSKSPVRMRYLFLTYTIELQKFCTASKGLDVGTPFRHAACSTSS